MGKAKKGLGSSEGASQKAPPKSRSAKAGLTMPVSKINRHLKEGKMIDRVGQAAPVYMAAVLEYAAAEVLELAGKRTEKDKRKRINPEDVTQAIRNDIELNKLQEGMVFFTGDKMTDITQAVTLAAPKKKKALESIEDEAQEE